MEHVKQAAKALKLYPKIKFGEMRVNERGHKVFFPDGSKHTVKITAEPATTMINKNGKQVRAFKFIVEENGELKKWLVPLTNEAGEGHYLVDRLQHVEVGEEIVLEMKKRGAKNYIDITKPGEEPDDEVEIGEEPDGAESDNQDAV